MAKMTKEEAVQWYAQNRGLYKKLSLKIHNIIAELLEEFNITVHAVTSRAKDLESLKNKIEDHNYSDPINQITDFSGIRIIAYVENDLKPICKIIEEAFDIDIENSSDKSDILGVDKVGYKSIHYIARIKTDRLNLPEYKKFKDLRFEIQIRTILQHAWAEIEHDKDYKFNGVLPVEIKRRFKILAGTLELADREFNQISAEIDKISKNVTAAERENKLDEVFINTTTLKQFLNNHFKSLIKESKLKPTFNNADTVIIKELQDFGIVNLSQLKAIIPSNFPQKVKEYVEINNPNNFIGLLRQLMIISDAKKYFSKCWNERWKTTKPSSKRIYSFYNVDIQNYLHPIKT